MKRSIIAAVFGGSLVLASAFTPASALAISITLGPNLIPENSIVPQASETTTPSATTTSTTIASSTAVLIQSLYAELQGLEAQITALESATSIAATSSAPAVTLSLAAPAAPAATSTTLAHDALTTGNGTASAPTAPLPPLIGAFRWDAWFPTVASVFPQYIPQTLFSDWSYREPSYGWWDADTAGAQAVMDQEINNAANHGLDFWVFDDYKYTEDVPQLSNQVPLYDAFKEYLASPYKDRLKFALAIGSGGAASAGGYLVGYWRSTYVPYLVSEFKDPQYLRVDGNRPVLFWLGAQDLAANFPHWSQDHGYLNQQAEAAGLGDPIIIETSMDATDAKTDGLDGLTSYGVMGNAAKPTSGCAPDPGGPTYHCPFASQSAQDESNWSSSAQSGLLAVPGLTAVDDSRAQTSPYGFYVDQPTYTQWQQEVSDAFSFMASNRSVETNPPLAVIYAWNELAEGGAGIIPTAQNGTMFLNAIEAVKTGSYPSNYQDVYNGDNESIVRTGNWIDYSPVPGNFNNDEEISLGIGDTATLTAGNATQFEIKGTEGPNRGVMQVFIDGNSQGTFTLTQSSWSQDQPLFTSQQLPSGTHTLKIVNASTNVSASEVGVDDIVVSQNASSAPAPTVSFAANGQTNITVNVGDPITYQWDVTNASSASGTYTEDGGSPQQWTGHPDTLAGSQTDTTASWEAGHTFVTTYTGVNAQGQTGQASVSVTVNPIQQSTITLTATPTSGGAPLSVLFDANGIQNNTTYTVTYGDGTSAQVQSDGNNSWYATHTYSAAGTYTATLSTGSCPSGVTCPVASLGNATVTVTGAQTSAPTITSFSVSPSTVQSGQSTTVSYAVTGMGQNDFCQVLPASAFSNSNNPSHPGNSSANWSGSFPTAPLTANTTLTLSCGSSDTSSASVTVTQPAACEVTSIYTQQVPGYVYDNLFMQVQNLPGDGNSVAITGADSWNNLLFNSTGVSGNTTTLEANQTINSTAASYIQQQENSIIPVSVDGTSVSCTNAIQNTTAAVSGNVNLANALTGLQFALQTLLGALK